jgi:hypothetical protein
MSDFQELEGLETHIPLLDSYGNFEMIPRENAHLAIEKRGYRVPSPKELSHEIAKIKVESNPLSPVRAGLEAAARTATMGVSDVAQTSRYLGVPAEEIKARRDLNPTASLVGDIAGFASPLKLPGVSKVMKFLMPMSKVSEVAGKVGEKAAPKVAKLVGSLVDPAKHEVAHTILTHAGTHAVGSAIEGAAFGLGHSVSEAALGDPGLNAEKVMANIGYSAIFAGGLGATFGGIAGGVKAVKDLRKPSTLAQDIEEYSIQQGSIPKEEKEGLLKSLLNPKLKKNAFEIKQAAEAIGGAPVTEGMIMDSAQVGRFESTLTKSPTIIGAKRQEMYQEGFQKAAETTERVFHTDVDVSKAELGKMLQDSISEKIENTSKPIQALYEVYEKEAEQVPLDPELKKQVIKNILFYDRANFDEGRKLAQKYVHEIEGTVNHAGIEIGGLHTVKDLKQFKTYIYEKLPVTASRLQKNIADKVYHEITNIEQQSILNFKPKKRFLTPEERAQVRDLKKLKQKADSDYKKLIQLSDPVLKSIRRNSSFQGTENFIERINEVTPESFANALFKKNDSGFLSFLKENYPKETKLLAEAEKQKWHKEAQSASEKNSMAGILKIVSNVENLPKEFRDVLLSPEEMTTLKQVETYLRSFPKDVNPSNTNQGRMYSEFLTPAGMVRNVKDVPISMALKQLSKLAGVESLGPVKELSKLEKFVKKTSSQIQEGAKEIFKFSEKVSPYVGSKLGTSSSQDYEKKIGEISALSNNPEKLLETLDEKTRSLYSFAPDTTGSVNQNLARATNFLNSKIRDQGVSSQFLPAKKPSFMDVSNFNKYVEIIEHPLQVLKQVKAGTLTSQAMEVMTQVYPKLLSEMQESVMKEMIDYSVKLKKGEVKTLPYQTLMSLSSFLGQPLDVSLSPREILRNQSTHAGGGAARLQNEMKKQQKMSGNSKFDAPSRIMTPMQKSSIRKD